MHRVVIVGGGFGGLYAAKSLRKAPVHVTLVDRRNFHVFQPLLYQVATAGLSPGQIAYPLRRVLRRQTNTTVLIGEVRDIDPASRRVILENGSIGYDTLLVCAGAAHSYFGHLEWEAIAPGLKTIEDATEMRSRIFLAFEAAERESDPIRRLAWLTFVVVGAGPTGVELAGALGEITRDTLRGDFRSVDPSASRILLLDAGTRVLAAYPEELSAKAESQLVRLGVRTRLGVKVVSIDAGGVTLESGERIESHTVLWAAGVQASPLSRILALKTGVSTDHAGRFPVAPDLSVPGFPEILVLGDMARLEQDGKLVPGVAPAAIQMGEYAARLIEARLAGRTVAPFRYLDKGNLATIGRNAAIADFGRVRLWGRPAWMAWLAVHIFFLIGFRNRLLVILEWAFSYFTFNRGARLITTPSGDLPRVEESTPAPADREPERPASGPR